MAKIQKTTDSQTSLIRISRLHFIYAAAIAAQIIIFDSWQLITPGAVLQRWVATALLLSTVAIVWYFAHATRANNFYARLTWFLILADIAFASFAVYTQRGMASRAVMLFVIPLLVSASLKNRSAIFATGVLNIAAYVTATVSYFVLNFNEGYRIELYGEVGFYCAIFLVVAGLLSSLVSSKSA